MNADQIAALKRALNAVGAAADSMQAQIAEVQAKRVEAEKLIATHEAEQHGPDGRIPGSEGMGQTFGGVIGADTNRTH